MNQNEKKMVGLLKTLKSDFAVCGLKAEFEAEGSRLQEVYRLKELCLASDLELTIKIGGCEAIRDLFTAKTIGVNHIVSPMIESAYALSKFITIIDEIFSKEEQKNIEFLINIETIRAVNTLDSILSLPDIHKIAGIVLGRTDLTGSMGLTDKNSVDSDEVFEIGRKVFSYAKNLKMKGIIGGTISTHSIPRLRAYCKDNLLDRFETRKVCFSLPDALNTDIEKGIDQSIYFELLWLKNKENYYKEISKEDIIRIKNLKKRFEK